MTTTKYPVDSTYHPCCHSIGRHGRDCQTEVPLPSGAEADAWVGGQRDVYASLGHVATSRDLLSCPVVTVVAEQRSDGTIGCIDVVLDGPMGRSDAGLSAAQARELAALLIAGADLADTWVASHDTPPAVSNDLPSVGADGRHPLSRFRERFLSMAEADGPDNIGAAVGVAVMDAEIAASCPVCFTPGVRAIIDGAIAHHSDKAGNACPMAGMPH